MFVDSAVPEWSTVVVVSEEGTECDSRSSVFQPMTPEQLVRHGIVKQHRLNLLPDWGVIIGVYHDCQTDIFDIHPLGIDDCKRNNCRHPESAAGCSGGRHRHSVGSATRQSQTYLSLEDKAKVAKSWGAFLSRGLCVQRRRVQTDAVPYVCVINVVHGASFNTRIKCFFM